MKNLKLIILGFAALATALFLNIRHTLDDSGIMKKIFSLLVIAFIFFSCNKKEIITIEDLLSQDFDSEYSIPFLNNLILSTDSIDNTNVKLIGYKIIGTNLPLKEKEATIQDVLDKSTFQFPVYDNQDRTFTNIQTYNYSGIEELKCGISHFKKQADSILARTKNFLKENIQSNYYVYSLTWMIKGDKMNTIAIFNNDGEFVYDNFISSLTTYEIKKLEPDSIAGVIRKSASSSEEIKSSSLGGVQITSYWIGSMAARGNARVTATGRYTIDCLPGGTGSSYCQPNLLAVEVSAEANMTWGSCDAQYVKNGNIGYGGHGTIHYAMYLATTGASASIEWTGDSFNLSISGDYSSIEKAVGEFSYFAQELPID